MVQIRDYFFSISYHGIPCFKNTISQTDAYVYDNKV